MKFQEMKRTSVGVLSTKLGKRIANLVVTYVFAIDDLESIAIAGSDVTTLSPTLLALLNAVVIGSTRGIMYSEFRGTFCTRLYFLC